MSPQPARRFPGVYINFFLDRTLIVLLVPACPFVRTKISAACPAMAAGRSAAVGWAASFPLPILLSLLLLPLPLTVAQLNETLSFSPSFCQNATCPSGESPNPYLYNMSGGNSCNCSITLQLSLVLEQASISSSWTTRLTRNLGRAFAAQLGINASQVRPPLAPQMLLCGMRERNVKYGGNRWNDGWGDRWRYRGACRNI